MSVLWHPMQLASCKRFPSALSPGNAAAQATHGISGINSDTHRMPFMVCLPRCGAERVMFLLLLHDRRRHQVQNQGHRTSGIDVHRPYLCQRHHRHCSLDKFSCVCASKSSAHGDDARPPLASWEDRKLSQSRLVALAIDWATLTSQSSVLLLKSSTR